MMLESLADRLNSASVAVTASNLFIGLMPDQPDLCVAIYEYSGQSPLEVLTSNTATLERPSVQVLVRASRNDYPTGRTLTASVRDVLTAITDETISGERFLRVNSVSSISALGVDSNDRPRFSLSLQVVMER
jgi:hypothetical protein